MSSEPSGGNLDALIDELARVFHDAGGARELVLRAGFPAAGMPTFDVPMVFWSRVVWDADAGRIVGGVRALVELAAARLPGNRFLAAYRSQGEGGSRTNAPPSTQAIDNRGASIGQQIVVQGDATFGPMTVGGPAPSSATPPQRDGRRDADGGMRASGPKRAPRGRVRSTIDDGLEHEPEVDASADGGITWIHLSDFHAGQAAKSVWNQVDTELRRSVEQMAKQLGVPDLVLFTGDLANRGAQAEYEQVDQLLDRIETWLGKKLPVVAVPGNHDLVRPKDAWRYAAFGSYEQQPGLREALWDGDDPLLAPLFPHYEQWMRTRMVPSLVAAGWTPHTSPRMPGDLSVVIEKHGLRLGLVGLNTAWIHLSDEAEGRLQLPAEQLGLALPKAATGNPLDWFQGLDAAFLLTHHPRGWLSKKALETYYAEVHPSDRFALALFGHMHEGRSEVVSISGAQPRAFFQAPSLFGLEYYGKANETRMMGYAWGRLSTSGEVRVWPLLRVRRGGGGHAFDRDQSFEEADDALAGVILVPGKVLKAGRPRNPGGAKTTSNETTSPARAAEDPLKEQIREYRLKIETLHRELRLAGFETKVRVPIGLEDLYEPLDAVIERGAERKHQFKSAEDAVGHDAQIELARAFEVAGQRGMRGVVLLGDPGSGKTTHLKQVLLKIVRDGAESIGLPPGTVPVFLPLRKLRNLDAGLPGFIEQELRDPLLDVDEGFGKRLCKSGKLLFLLDGLDEVANAEDRRRVARWIEDARRGGSDNHFLVSCRFSGYTPDAQLDENFLELHLRPMSPPQVESFVRKWYGIVERATNPDPVQAQVKADAGVADLLATLRKPEMRSARVYTMTHNPLLLTTICLVHRDRGTLPDKRVVLYEEAVSVLLERWRRVTKELNVTFPAREALQVLVPVAEWMHAESGRIRAKSDELVLPVADGLAAIGRTDVPARTFLETIRDESGLLTGWGVDEFGFMHLGFQEYLAARGIRARVFDDPEALAELAGNFTQSWWQEVILLLLAEGDPPMFRRFMGELVKRVEFPEWARSELMGLCWTEAFGVTAEPFVELLRRTDSDSTLAARQLAVVELMARRIPSALGGLEELLSQHPAEQVRRWWRARTEQTGKLETRLVAGVEMVRVPAGWFLMGSGEKEIGRDLDESPQHGVELTSFWLARTPVTNAQYRRFLEASDRDPTVEEPKYWGDRRCNQPDQPVVGVSWHGAKAYCEWTGLSLPTEAQWEYACRAGTTTRYWPGDQEEDLARVGWYAGNSDGRLHAVKELEPNAWGLYDMHGNVYEWCEDAFGTYATWPRVGDGLRHRPLGNGSRVMRGGHFADVARYARSAYRYRHFPEESGVGLGFRPALDLPRFGGHPPTETPPRRRS